MIDHDLSVSPQSSERTIRGDIFVHADLLDKDMCALVMELASSYGHEWFSRNAFNAVLQKMVPRSYFLPSIYGWGNKRMVRNKS
jgi:hypothetical protein